MPFLQKGWSVVIAGVGINLVIGVLYAWSIFKEAISASIQSGGAHAFHWNPTCVNDPYALCCLVFAFSMVLAGNVQDAIGPRKTATIGAILGGLGFLIIGNSLSYWTWMLGFGGLIGAGTGFAYAATTPAALRWFAPNKSSLITSIVVSGFALAALYIAPLATYLIKIQGLEHAMLFFGAEFFILVGLFACLLNVPSSDTQLTGFQERRRESNDQARHQIAHLDEEAQSFKAALKDQRFWILWALLFIGAGVGLMVIGNLKPLAKLSLGDFSYLAIMVLAVGDATGRILSALLSARFGRRKILSMAFLGQAILMFCTFYAANSGSVFYFVLLATLIGLNYGANLVIFPSYVKDFWGMKHFGTIYGLLFTAWGLGGFIIIKLAEKVSHVTDSNWLTFMLAGGLMLIATLTTFLLDNRKDIERAHWRKEKLKQRAT